MRCCASPFPHVTLTPNPSPRERGWRQKPPGSPSAPKALRSNGVFFRARRGICRSGIPPVRPSVHENRLYGARDVQNRPSVHENRLYGARTAGRGVSWGRRDTAGPFWCPNGPTTGTVGLEMQASPRFACTRRHSRPRQSDGLRLRSSQPGCRQRTLP